jgi:hypothetical protein
VPPVGQTVRVKPEPLSPDEVATLPPRRARWVCHVAALLTAGMMAGWAWAMIMFAKDLDHAINPDRLKDWESGLLMVSSACLCWVPLAPFLQRVGLTWPYAFWMTVIPFVVPVVAWKVGFRLAAIPHRDWRPGSHQIGYVHPIPDTGFHVTTQDLARWAGRRTPASARDGVQPEVPAR